MNAMNYPVLWRFLMVSAVLLAAGGAVHVYLPDSLPLSAWLGQWLFFALLTTAVLVSGGLAIGHRNPNLFTALSLGSTLGKLGICLIFLLIFRKVWMPEDRVYLGLFFLYYLGFTLIEFWLLHVLVQQDGLQRRRAGTTGMSGGDGGVAQG